MTVEKAIHMLTRVIISPTPNTDKAIMMAVDALREREKMRWIPCKERMPEEREERYWVCTDDGYECQCRWTNINHIWNDLTTEWHWHIIDVPKYSEVVAWMPLPDVYDGE